MAYRACLRANSYNVSCRFPAIPCQLKNPGPSITRFHTSRSIKMAKYSSSFVSFCSHRAVLSCRKPARMTIFRRSYCQKTEDVAKAEKFIEKARDFWNGPTFKYWFVGVTAFSSWLAYYSLKSYRGTRVSLSLPLPLPNHVLVERESEIKAVIEAIEKCQPIGRKVKGVVISGPSGSGKSILSHHVADELMRQVDWNPIGLPKSHTNVFLPGDTLKAFLLSLQALAANLKIKPVEIRNKIDELGYTANKTDQCKATLHLIKEKLEKHPKWVMVVDNLQQDTSDDVASIINEMILSEENAAAWSKGTMILTLDGMDSRKFQGVPNFQMKPRFSERDAVHVLKEVTNIKDEHFETSNAAKILMQRISHHPVATVCAGILLKERLEKKEMRSIDGVIMELIKDVTSNCQAVINNSPMHHQLGISESLIMAETLIAMTMKMLLCDKPHLSSSFDMMSACAPRTPIPSTFLSRYLRHPSLKLPSLKQPTLPQSNLQQMFKTQPTVDNKDESLDPKGKAWSNKSITEYITKIEGWFTETWQAVKEVYNLYYGEIPLEKVDNSIQILQDCELLVSSKLQPGDVESYSMHPLVYAVARQHFLSNHVLRLEEEFLVNDELQYDNQVWFKKMSNYEPKTNLIRFRNQQTKMEVSAKSAGFLVNSYNNALINVSSILNEPDLKHDESSYRFMRPDVQIRYVQNHLDRIIQSIGEEVRLSKQTVSGKTVVKFLDIHREYLDSAYPVEFTGVKAKINERITSAKIASSVEKDDDKAITEMQTALQSLKDSDPDNSLEVASILCQLAALFNSKEDHENGMKYLQEAVDMYELQRRKDGEYKRPLDLGKALGALGVVKGTLGDRVKSKELIERGLMMQQTGAPDLADEAKSKHFGGEFASALVDLGHAYVSLGMPLYGKKILDLALMAHKNIHGEKHPEVVRTLTVLSIAHLMQGHNEESKRLRKEAGKIQSQINSLPLY